MLDFMNPAYERAAGKFIRFVGDNTPDNGQPLMLGRIAQIVDFEGDPDEQSVRAWKVVVEPLKDNGLVDIGDPTETTDLADGETRFCSSVALTGEGWKAYRRRGAKKSNVARPIEKRTEQATSPTRRHNDLTQRTIDRAFEAARSHTQNMDRAFEVARSHTQRMDTAFEVARSHNDRIQKILDSVSRDQRLIRSLTGGISELQGLRIDLISPSALAGIQKAQEIAEQFHLRFEQPALIDTLKLLADFQKDPLAEVMGRYRESADSLGSLLQSMTTPWLEAHERLGSIKGLAQIQGISSLLDRSPSYDKYFSNALRVDLGDWRDQITFPKVALEDIGARVDFYEGLGFDPSLTNFPAEAFQEALTESGLRREPPSHIKIYAPPITQEEEESAFEFERTEDAYSWLLRLETHLRSFIDEKMTNAFGEDWPRHRLPNGLYERWAEKKRKIEKEGRASYPLISYADFADYALVILRRDNWKDVFSNYFHRLEDIRESLQRLYFIRLDTMHARLIAQEDELLLVVEVRRIFKAIS